GCGAIRRPTVVARDMNPRTPNGRLFAVIAALALLISSGTPALAQEAKGKKYALLVGVKDYDHSSLSPLKYTENDVNEFAKVLKGKEAGFTEVVILTTTASEKDEAL